MYTRNQKDWFPTETNYTLVFMEVKDPDGELCWREVSHNLAKYNNMLLAEYLLSIGIYIPDYTQFLRIVDRESNFHFEYRSYGGRVRVDVSTFDF